ncbi:MAG: TIGR03000 domain-containing protein [Thermoguttaceae bacterium]
MLRPSWKHILVVAVAVLALTIVSQSYACCGWGCGCSGWYGGAYGCGGCGWGCDYTACAVGCTPCCDLTLGCRPFRHGGCYGYGWGWGGCYASCTCCSPCGGCNCGCLPYYTPTMGCCGAGMVPGMTAPAAGTPTPATKPATPPAPGEAPATPPAPAPTVPAPTTTPTVPAPTIPPTPGTTGVPSLEDSALLTVYVPYQAKITINGLPTQSTGSRRQYASFGLKPGMNYKYDIHAEIVRDGKIIEENKTVTLTAGQQNSAAFGFNKPAEGMAGTEGMSAAN